ncbi:methyltransferase domain-containing protein [Iamia sp.]|uniref:methyltransferase domain-containing protein n=1 Tax=Iamia sp. TaxID=2722710 RepID=UPI002C696135|nr:methyltransferase domain-containing protein [Iamia sp.]HXH55683.1 methyltransferase domain-containing protein [Iamia sp.]
MRSFGLVVPLFDEEERFPEFGKLLLDFVSDQPPGSELIFVDDGSGDATADLVDAMVADNPHRPVRLVRRPHEGKGAAVAAGLRTSTAADRGFCDLDLSTPLDQLEQVLRAAQRVPALAVGSRDLAASRLLRAEGPIREALGRSYNRLLQITITPGVVDTQCGAKVAAAPVWEAVLPHCREAGFAWDAEVIAIAGALGIGVQEIPIDWRHDERSKVNVGRDGLAMVWAIPRIWRRARLAAGAADRSRIGAHPPSPAGAAASDAGGPAPEIFDEANAEKLMAADRDHWWFRSKAALVSTALRRTATGAEPGEWLVDAGAGSGGVTSLLGWRPDRVVVVEGNHALVSRAHGAHGLLGLQGGVDALPVADGSAHVVCLLDVIEHLDDPVAALREAVRALAPGGRLVINVPAHQWLWSAADESLGHVRRYDRHLLRRQLATVGLEPTVITHVFSWLVVPVWVTRRLASGGQAELGLDRTSMVIDRTAMVLTRLERALIGRASVPLGTSLLCVAVRQSEATPPEVMPHRGRPLT